MCRRFGIKNPEQEYRRFRKVHTFNVRNFAAWLKFSPQNNKKFISQFYSFFKKPRRYNYPSLQKFLKDLGTRYHLILLTYGTRREQQLKIKQSGLKPYFRKIIFTTDSTKRKLFKDLSKTYGKDLIIVDDFDPVLSVARKLGLKAIKAKSDQSWRRKL